LDPQIPKRGHQYVGGSHKLKRREGVLVAVSQLMTPSGQDLRDPEAKDDRHRNLDELESVQDAPRSAEALCSAAGFRAA
jgi:hypothetical protein